MPRESPERGPKGRRRPRRDWDERDIQFLEEMVRYGDDILDLEKYANLFRFKGALISGDVTSYYGALGPETIEAVQRELPETKGILLIRDPVARAWSSISMLAGRTASIWPCSRIRSNFVSISNAKGYERFPTRRKSCTAGRSTRRKSRSGFSGQRW
jgi:hypothetical protein